jgi:hypothetical protein
MQSSSAFMRSIGPKRKYRALYKITLSVSHYILHYVLSCPSIYLISTLFLEFGGIYVEKI